MELHTDDAGFVRGPAWLVHRRLADISGWPGWWLGTRVRPAPSGAGTGTWLVELRGAPLRRLRLIVRPHSWRHPVGFRLEVSGDLTGEAEFWLEPGHGGTTVHHLLTARTDRPAPARLRTEYRRAVRRGLWGLKDVVQLEARASAGLLP